MFFTNRKLIQFLRDLVDLYGIQSFDEFYIYLSEIDLEKLDKLDMFMFGGASDVS